MTVPVGMDVVPFELQLDVRVREEKRVISALCVWLGEEPEISNIDAHAMDVRVKLALIQFMGLDPTKQLMQEAARHLYQELKPVYPKLRKVIVK